MLHLNQKTKEKSNQSKEKFIERLHRWKYWFYTHKPLKGGTRTKSYSYDE